MSTWAPGSVHVTKITQRASRRINGARGARVNLCGAALTDQDVTIADARRMQANGKAMLLCFACHTAVGEER
jgi:hypothetical protein